MALHINDEEVELVHFAGGHTDGDSVVFFKSANVVHTGDHFFNGFFPFVDVDSGGNVLVMAENVKSLLAMIDDDTKIIPGHGPLANKADLMAFQQMLEGTAAEVKVMKDKGFNLEKAQKQGLTDKWQSWTDGFLTTDVWISIVYSSL
jgi:glyoxylase-like metal-dependent hydrolase (beta-lactamase superfamily II)